MKRVLLLRHAKSSWADAGLADFDRPLNERGRECAEFMGRLIAERGFAPDLILTSPALRARQTADLLKESGGLDAPMKFDERIYEASPHTLRQVVADINDQIESVMVVGHNPGFEGFITFLTGEHEPIPTAGLAVLDVDIPNWAEIAHNSGSVSEIIRPKDVIRTA